MSAADKRSQHRNRRRAGQGGYALMLVFAMAAGIAIMLYMQLPRAAFQAQREKEQLLIERGEQYTRAIQLYVNVWKKYPASLDDLEKTNGKRYLRRRYVDPMTGKDEWKLIKIDGAGVLQNSVSSKKPASETTNQNTFITEAAGVGQMANATTAGQNLGLRRRPSEGGEGGLEPMPSSGAPSPQLGQGPNAEGATPVVPNPMINNGVAQPGVNAGQPQGFNSNQQQGFNPNQPQGFAANQQQGFNPNQPQGFNPNQPQGFNPNQPVPNSGPPPGFSPGQQGYGQLPNYNSGPQNPGQPGVPPGPGVQPLPPQIQSTLMGGVQPNPQNPNANPNQPQPVQPGYGQPNTPSPGYGQPNTPSPYYGGPNNAGQFNPGQNRYPGQGNLPGGQPGNQPGNQPGYMNTPGMTPSPQATGNAAVDAINRQLTSPRQPPFPGAPAGFQLGGGIAGVASTAEIESIKIYNERQQYNEWEFIYDPKKDKRTAMGARGQQSQGPGNPLGGSPPPGSPLGGPPGGPGVGPGGIPPGMPPSMNPPGLPPGAQRGGGR